MKIFGLERASAKNANPRCYNLQSIVACVPLEMVAVNFRFTALAALIQQNH